MRLISFSENENKEIRCLKCKFLYSSINIILILENDLHIRFICNSCLQFYLDAYFDANYNIVNEFFIIRKYKKNNIQMSHDGTLENFELINTINNSLYEKF